jgi:hypothetical protein
MITVCFNYPYSAKNLETNTTDKEGKHDIVFTGQDATQDIAHLGKLGYGPGKFANIDTSLLCGVLFSKSNLL